ncbi:MAG: hypothetical protein KDE14_16330, partial [Rhodobacteraceae bacterium]|nr:hypothetical protein [Paracoccaceae bacterium]
MLIEALLAIHIAVLGYWLGSEFVINSEYRYVCRTPSLPFAERNKLMEHVLDVDQHVRYALVLQAVLGTILAALIGYIPGGATLAWIAAAVGVVWLAFVEVIHHLRNAPAGKTLALIDRVIRYVLMASLFAVGGAVAMNIVPLPVWLAAKLALFGGVIACGVGIRLSIIAFYGVWREIEAQGSNDAREQEIRWIYT